MTLKKSFIYLCIYKFRGGWSPKSLDLGVKKNKELTPKSKDLELQSMVTPKFK